MRLPGLKSGRNSARKPDFRPGSTIAQHRVHALIQLMQRKMCDVNTERRQDPSGAKFGALTDIDSFAMN